MDDTDNITKVPSDFDFLLFTFSCTIRLSYSSCRISIHYEHQKSFNCNIYFREFTALFQGLLRMEEKTSKAQKYFKVVLYRDKD